MSAHELHASMPRPRSCTLNSVCREPRQKQQDNTLLQMLRGTRCYNNLQMCNASLAALSIARSMRETWPKAPMGKIPRQWAQSCSKKQTGTACNAHWRPPVAKIRCGCLEEEDPITEWEASSSKTPLRGQGEDEAARPWCDTRTTTRWPPQGARLALTRTCARLARLSKICECPECELMGWLSPNNCKRCGPAKRRLL